jgi:hypothetical protein
MEKFIYNDDVLTVEASPVTHSHYVVELIDCNSEIVFKHMYNTNDEHLAMESAKADYCKIRENRTVNNVLAEFEAKNHFYGFSEEELTTLAWAFTHPGFELIYSTLYESLNEELKVWEKNRS